VCEYIYGKTNYSQQVTRNSQTEISISAIGKPDHFPTPISNTYFQLSNEHFCRVPFEVIIELVVSCAKLKMSEFEAISDCYA
jgi:hypothetical protein